MKCSLVYWYSYSSDTKREFLIWSEMSRDTKVNNFNDKLVLVACDTPAQMINQQVLWLNVTMHNLSLMAMSDG